ncbi:talin-2-like [Ostrea edulis]|uniref:talin-2-like n=1 Tax=Ostrea edulis TaxID=37623 RepID=UPI0024AED116|nr:talin-2-like [Ostrea edulis]
MQGCQCEGKEKCIARPVNKPESPDYYSGVLATELVQADIHIHIAKIITTTFTSGSKAYSGGKQTLAAVSRQVATSVQDIVHCAELIKDTDWVDPEDPTVIAESELLTAAKSIEAAAQKLSQLKPRKKAKEADMSLNFDEQILEAAKSIASATAALVRSAQRELVAQGKAKMVTAATHSLCESANAMVQGHATEERLIASAKEVAGSTAHLLVACRVKADPDSVAMKRLQAAGNAVKRATEVLVKAAKQDKQRDEDDVDVAVDSREVGGIKQWIEAREKLAKFRKQRYKDNPQDNDSSSPF